MSSKDVKRASVISSRIFSPFLAGVLVAQIAELKKRMMNSVVCFEFVKKNGELTRRWGTTSPSLAVATTTGTGLSGDARNVVTFLMCVKELGVVFNLSLLLELLTNHDLL